jgi:hypothetical protein
VQSSEGVVERRKVKERRRLKRRRRQHRFFGIVGQRVGVQIERSLVLLRFDAADFEQCFDFGGLEVQGLAESSEIVRQNVRLGPLQHEGAISLRDKGRIGKVSVPIEIVVDAAVIVASVGNVERGDAEMVDEDRKIGA